LPEHATKIHGAGLSQIEELFALHQINPQQAQADDAVLAGHTRGLSGGDNFNVGVNAMHTGNVDSYSEKWVETQGMIKKEIEKVRKAKPEHSGEKGGAKRRIGFQH